MGLNLEMLCLLLMMCFLLANKLFGTEITKYSWKCCYNCVFPDRGQNIFCGTRDIRVTNSVLSRKECQGKITQPTYSHKQVK